MSLLGKKALITGASRGIGRGIAEKLAAKGAQVILVDVLEKELFDIANDLKEDGVDVSCFVLDVANEKQVIETVQQINNKLGGIDILVNNAGISPKVDGKRRSTHDIPLEEWINVLNVNLTGAFLLTRECVPGMIENKWGRIINMSSQAGRTYSRIAGSHYAASKSGIIGFTRTIASEYGKNGITANCVAPGRIETPMATNASTEVHSKFIRNIPVGRSGTVDEVASLVYYLCTEEAGFINGTTVDINGGMYMS